MTVELALLITSEGIALAHRQAAGHWAILQDVSFSASDLDKAMRRLKKEADARAGDDAPCLLILPDDQILYTSLTAPTNDPEMTAFRVEEGLEGMTPYAVSELVYDWRAAEADRVKLAVVARETLDEARGFANAHGFKAAGFAAMPPQERFPGVPLFELADDAQGLSFTEEGIAFGPDQFGQEPEETPDVAPEDGSQDAETIAGPEDSTTEPNSSDAVSEGNDAQESADTATAGDTDDATVEFDAPPEPEADDGTPQEPEPEPEPDPEADALADAADRDPEEVIASAAIAPTDDITSGDFTDVAPPAPPLEDPALTGPVAQNDDTGTDSVSDVVRATRNASAALESDAPMEFSARGDPVPARDIEDDHGTAGAPADSPGGDDADQGEPTPAGQNPLAERLSRVRDASKSRAAEPTKTSAKPSTRPSGKASGKPIVPPGRDAGRAAPPERKGRLSSLTAAPFPGTAPRGAEEAPQGLSGRFGALIGRGQKSDGVAPPPPGTTPPPRPGAAPVSTTGRLTALGEALRSPPDTPGDTSVASGESGSAPIESDDKNITGGLLGRKPDETDSPTFRTGLLLTIVLLILLAAIAVWSALFLPDSPVARLFGGGSNVAVEDPLDAPDAPLAITAPPAIGELATVDAPPATLPDTVETVTDGAIEGEITDASPEDEAAADGIDLAAAPLTDATAPEVVETAAPEVPEIPALPPLPLDGVPSLEETEAVYAEYRIWQRPPDRPDLAPLDSLSDLSLSARDPAVTALDAISLPTPRLDPSETFRTIPAPPPFGAEIETTPQGLVAATPEGVVTPDGVLVTVGPPPVTAIPRPREEVLPARTPTFSIEDAILGTFRPAPRPGDLGQADVEDAVPGQPVITRASLSPQPRTLPGAPSAAQQASAASLFPGDRGNPETAPNTAISPSAVTQSLVPSTRPGNMETLIANAIRPARQGPAPVVEAAAVAPGPAIPSNADVARAATQRNELRLREVNLIGVTGTASDRRALVRLPSGRFVRVGVGDRLNGGRVAAIGASTLQYVRSGRTVTLDIPG